MKIKNYFILLILVFSATACLNENTNMVDSEEAPVSGVYYYTGFDSIGTIISIGRLNIQCGDSSVITGNWEIHKVGNPGNIGPQIGEGKLQGSFEHNDLILELNPQFRDNNLQLTGKLKNNDFNGKWHYISFAGVTNWGAFETKWVSEIHE